MKLYFSPNSLALSTHIALLETTLPHELVQVDAVSKTIPGGQPYASIHPLQVTPALALDDGQILTESSAILMYLADRAPAARLAPPPGEFARYRLLEWMNFIAAEIHQTYMRFAIPDAGQGVLAHAVQRLAQRYARVEQALAADGPYLLGADFSVADAQLYSTMRWCALIGLDLAPWPALQAHMRLVAQRPAVRQALAAQGLDA